jgi:hypothetical protein
MPLAQAAQRIGCERPPSLAHLTAVRVDPAPAFEMRRPASKKHRDRSVRAQAKVVRDGRPQTSGPSADITMIQARIALDLAAAYPSAENRHPAETSCGELGSPPYHRLRERQFGSDILRKTGRNLSARSIELATTMTEPEPTLFGSRRFLCARVLLYTLSACPRFQPGFLLLRLVPHLETT